MEWPLNLCGMAHEHMWNGPRTYVPFLWKNTYIKKPSFGDGFLSSATLSRLGFDVFLDGQFAAVVTAFGTYVMHQDLSTTVAARGQLRSLKAVVRSSFSCSRL